MAPQPRKLLATFIMQTLESISSSSSSSGLSVLLAPLSCILPRDHQAKYSQSSFAAWGSLEVSRGGVWACVLSS